MGYRIKTIADLTGVPRNTLLAWERRYAVVEPRRLANGYRSYSEDDLRALQRVKALIDAGYKVSEAISLLRSGEPRATLQVHDDTPAALANQLEEALLSFNREEALKLIHTLGTWSFLRRIDGVCLPLLRRLGTGWAQGSVTIAQEHFASAFLHERLASILAALDYGPADGPRALLACFPDEYHELALLALGVRMALRGWRVVFLGAAVPVDTLLDTARQLDVTVVAVSLIRPREAEEVEAVARRVRRSLPASMRLVYGGSGLPEALPTVDGVEWYRTAGEFVS